MSHHEVSGNPRILDNPNDVFTEDERAELTRRGFKPGKMIRDCYVFCRAYRFERFWIYKAPYGRNSFYYALRVMGEEKAFAYVKKLSTAIGIVYDMQVLHGGTRRDAIRKRWNNGKV